MRDDRREQEDRARDKMGSSNDNFHTISDDKETVSEAEENLDDQDMWYALDEGQYEAMIGRREARKELQHAQKSRRFLKNGDGRGQQNRAGTEGGDDLQPVGRAGSLGGCMSHGGTRQKSSPSDRSSGSSKSGKYTTKRTTERNRPSAGAEALTKAKR